MGPPLAMDERRADGLESGLLREWGAGGDWALHRY